MDTLNNSTNGINYKRYYLSPGYVYVPEESTIIVTILGSCISVCMYDTFKKYGGMNHFLLPKPSNGNESTTKFGNVAIYNLYKTFLEFGSKKEDLVACIVGGGYIEDSKDSKFIASQNIKISKDILKKLKIKIIFEDTGGILGRKVYYYTEDNKLEVMPIQKIDEKYVKIIDGIGLL